LSILEASFFRLPIDALKSDAALLGLTFWSPGLDAQELVLIRFPQRKAQSSRNACMHARLRQAAVLMRSSLLSLSLSYKRPGQRQVSPPAHHRVRTNSLPISFVALYPFRNENRMSYPPTGLDLARPTGGFFQCCEFLPRQSSVRHRS